MWFVLVEKFLDDFDEKVELLKEVLVIDIGVGLIKLDVVLKFDFFWLLKVRLFFIFVWVIRFFELNWGFILGGFNNGLFWGLKLRLRFGLILIFMLFIWLNLLFFLIWWLLVVKLEWFMEKLFENRELLVCIFVLEIKLLFMFKLIKGLGFGLGLMLIVGLGFFINWFVFLFVFIFMVFILFFILVNLFWIMLSLLEVVLVFLKFIRIFFWLFGIGDIILIFGIFFCVGFV